jgi:hypothetical protein
MNQTLFEHASRPLVGFMGLCRANWRLGATLYEKRHPTFEEELLTPAHDLHRRLSRAKYCDISVLWELDQD